MAITFQEKKEKQKYLTLVFLVTIFVIFLLVYFGFLKKEKPFEVREVIYQPPKIEINFDILKSPFLKELLPFEEIKEFEGKIGRENPFLPY